MVQTYKNAAFEALGPRPQLAATLIIAFYNNARLLDLTLAAVSRQDVRNFEVVICDDGSSPDVVEHVQKKLNQMSVPAKHLWHEDRGFRKNRILNWGVHCSDSDFLIFIDQDCLPHPQFVREHIENREPRTVLCGRRMDLTPWFSRLLSPRKIQTGFIEKNLWWLIPASLYMKDNNSGKGIYLKSPLFRRLANRKERGIVGCNFSVFKEDLLAINGFDWRYEGPGSGEDSDIEYRMRLLGIRMKSFVNTAVQYHVWHKVLARAKGNEKILAQVQNENQPETRYGLREQLEEERLAENSLERSRCLPAMDSEA